MKTDPNTAEKCSPRDAQLADVVELLGNRLHAGQPADLAAWRVEFPELASELSRLLPTIQALADLSGEAAVPAGGDAEALGMSSALGDFRILRPIGRGGMGAVYEAEQLSLGRKVALKVLPFAALADERALKRFQNEVRAAATLDHPHVVPVYAVGEDRGVHYYAMKLVRGASLAAVIAELSSGSRGDEALTGDSLGQAALSALPPAASSGDAATLDLAQGHVGVPSGDTITPAHDRTAHDKTAPLPVRTEFFRSAARVALEAAEALHHAHERGVIHRDVKPGNLLVEGNGHTWVTDFGLARIVAEAGMTMTGDLVGTLRYMSPEQALAQRVVVDHRTDIYSLGATLYELVTLSPLFAGEDRQALLRQIAFEDPTRPRRLNRAIRPELETVILKCLEKNPDERYASAGDLADDLRRYLEDRPIQARPPGLVQRTRRWGRRHRPAVAALLFVLAALGIGGPLVAVKQSSLLNLAKVEGDRARASAKAESRAHHKARQSARRANRARNAAVADRKLADKRRRAAIRHQYTSDMQLAQQAQDAGNTRRVRSLLDRYLPESSQGSRGQEADEDLRGWEWWYLHRQHRRGDFQMYGAESYVRQVAISPDGRTLYAGSEGKDGALAAWDLVSGDLTYIRRLVPFSSHFRLRITPDGKRVVMSNPWNSSMEVMDAVSGKGIARSAPLAIHPDGGQVAFIGILGQRRAIVLRDLFANDVPQADARPVESTSSTLPSDIVNLLYSPDGARLAVAGGSSLVVYDTNTWAPVFLYPAASSDSELPFRKLWYLAWSADSTRLAIDGSSTSAEVNIVEERVTILNAASGQVESSWATGLSWQAGTLVAQVHKQRLAWSPSGNFVGLSRLDWVQVWDVALGGRVLNVVSPSLNDSAIEFTPTDLLVTHSLEHAFRVDDPRTSKQLVQVNEDVGAVAVSGTWLAAGQGHLVRIWDLNTGQEREPLRGHDDKVTAMAWSSDGKRIVSGGESGSVNLWNFDPEAQSDSAELVGHQGGVGALDWSHDDRWLTSAGVDRTLRVWDVANNSQANMHALPESEAYALYGGGIEFSADDKQILAAVFVSNVAEVEGKAYHEGRVRAFDAHSELRSDLVTGCFGGLTWVGRGREPNRLLWAGCLGSVELRSLADGRAIQRARVPLAINNLVTSCDCTPDGRMLAVASNSGLIWVWDVSRNTWLPPLSAHAPSQIAVAFSPSGRMLASVDGRGTLALWRVGGRAARSLRVLATGAGFMALDWSPDGKRLATCGDSVKIWDPGTGRELLSMQEGTASVGAVAWSHDSSRLAWAGSDGIIRIGNGSPAQAGVNPSPTSPEADRSFAEVQHHLAVGNLHAGRLEAAEQQLSVALEILERLVAEHPLVPVLRRDLVASHWARARLLATDQRTDEAVAAYRSAAALVERLLSDFPTDALIRPPDGRISFNFADSIPEPGSSPESAPLAALLHELAALLATHDRFTDAADAYRQALSKASRQAEVWITAGHAIAISEGLVSCLDAMHDPAGARTAREGLLQLYEERAAVRADPRFRFSLPGLVNSGVEMRTDDNYRQASRKYQCQEIEHARRCAIALCDVLGREEGTHAEFCQRQSANCNGLALVLLAYQRPADALAEAVRAVSLIQEITETQLRQPPGWQKARCLMTLANCLLAERRYVEALEAARSASDLLPMISPCQTEVFEMACRLHRAANDSAAIEHGKLSEAERQSLANDCVALARDTLARAAATVSDEPGAQNTVAWHLATSPIAEARDPARAVELAHKALAQQPEAAGIWNTLGAAQYRAGDWDAAVEAMTKSIALSSGGSAADYFFLAMAHWQLGAHDEAHTWNTRAVEWMDSKAPQDEELPRFRAEAEQLLGALAAPSNPPAASAEVQSDQDAAPPADQHESGIQSRP